jgi:hypothetical protein
MAAAGCTRIEPCTATSLELQRPATAEEVNAAFKAAAAGQLQRVVVPAYTYYWTAYQTLLERGYHVDFTMVRMKRGKQEDYEDASDLVLDDWR